MTIPSHDCECCETGCDGFASHQGRECPCRRAPTPTYDDIAILVLAFACAGIVGLAYLSLAGVLPS